MSLINELKRRNVIRVSMVYLAGAWLLVQVADTLIPWLGLDEAVGRYLLILLGLGFIPTVVATWLFEWTPEGIRFDEEVEVGAAGEVVARRRLDRIIIGILTVALVYFAVDELLFDATQPAPGHDERSIAVLPFEDISPDGDQAYLGNGIADELRLELQQLEGLRVAGRTSSNAFAQEDSKTIGELLNVQTILEGSVRKDGDSVRITVQLTDLSDGFAIWSESYNRKLEKILEMQEEIATSVAGALGVRLGVGGVNAFHGAGTQNVEAYEAYLQSRSHDWTVSGVHESMPLLEQAIELDPNYAAAWSMLALRVLVSVFDVAVEEAPGVVERARQIAVRGVELDPESATSHSVLALVRMNQLDWIGSEQSHAQAMALLSDRLMHERYGVMLFRSGRTAAAQKQFALAMELEPMGGRPPITAWHASLAQGRFDEAREISNWQSDIDILENNLDIAFNEPDPEVLKAAIRAIQQTDLSYADPENRNEPLRLSYTHVYGPLLAEFDSPDRVLPVLREVYRDESVQWPRKLHDIAMAAAYFGDSGFALKVKGEEVRINPVRMGGVWYPVMSEARQLPEFKALVEELNLVDYWRTYGWADACRPIGDTDFECL